MSEPPSADGAADPTGATEADDAAAGDGEGVAGSFGPYGGQFVPEALMPALAELADAHRRYVRGNEDGFRDDLRERLRTFGGRPTPLQRAEGLSARYGTDVYLKREDLLHGGAHKLNNALGQVLLADYMGKERVIAETGAGQHGTATAMAAAHVGIPCEVYMGRVDVNRQRPNVFRMRACGTEVTPVDIGSATLKEAITETLRDWAATVEDTHYVIGSVVGPHPFPALARDLQAVVSKEARRQVREEAGELPGAVVACAGGGSNAMGSFHHFVEDENVALVAVEAGGDGGDDGEELHVDADAGVAHHSASLTAGEEGILHGARTRLLQDEHGQVLQSHSVSAGLDYAGVGPELAALADEGRVSVATADDEAALAATHRLARLEGIIPALETAHAFGYLEEHADDLDGPVVMTVSGRGDKDLETLVEETTRRELPGAPDMEVFR